MVGEGKGMALHLRWQSRHPLVHGQVCAFLERCTTPDRCRAAVVTLESSRFPCQALGQGYLWSDDRSASTTPHRKQGLVPIPYAAFSRCFHIGTFKHSRVVCGYLHAWIFKQTSSQCRHRYCGSPRMWRCNEASN